MLQMPLYLGRKLWSAVENCLALPSSVGQAWLCVLTEGVSDFFLLDSSHTDRLPLQCRPAHSLLLPDDVARVNSHCLLPQVPGVST